MRNWLVLGVSALVVVSFISREARAQDQGKSEGQSEISLFLGSMLPNQIDGVTEILPVFGGRYSFAAFAGMAELGLSNSHAEGVDFTVVDASMRGDLPAMDDFGASIYGGLNFSFYRPVTANDRTTETGIHLGAALMMHASDTLWFRTDLKFMANPGTSLLLLFGIVFR